jgi:3-oxoacyl-[acyl-carrier-protein] synthase-3
MNVGIEAITYRLGSDRLTNEELESANPQWDMARTIERTGVKSRPTAAVSETALDLGEEAVVALLQKQKLCSDQIDALIFCTQTPDYVLPPNSTLLHGRLGMPHGVMAFDIMHACSGFIYGMGIGRSLVQSGMATRVLLVTADTYTKLLHPQDRSTRPIFGDGAAATLISTIAPLMHIVDMTFCTAGKQAHRFIVKSGGARHPWTEKTDDAVIDGAGRVRSDAHVYMDGMGVLSFFTSVVPKAVKDILARNQLSKDDVALFVFHQASKLALDGLQRSMGIPLEKMVCDLQDTGNLVSASIPVALARAMTLHRLQPGQLIVLCGFGVGLSWGTALVRFIGEEV